MKRQLKILSILDIPWFSGLTSYAIDQARGLRERGHTVFLGAPVGSALYEMGRKENFVVIEMPHRKNLFILPALFKLKRFIENEKIDIVLSNTGNTQTLACLAQILSKNKFSIIRTKTDAVSPQKSLFMGKIKKIITGSEFIREKYLKSGISPDKVVTIYQGILSPKISDLNVPSGTYKCSVPSYDVTKKPTHYKIGILGRLDTVKGHSHFIEAAAIVLKKRKDLSFLIAGKEVNVRLKQIQEQVDRLQITDYIKYLGYVPDNFEFINECNIGVIASVGSEVVSRVLFEWMACSKPVIATKVGSIPEILPGKYLVQPGNPEQLAEKLQELLNSPINMAIIGAENQKLIEKRYNFKNFIDKTENLIFETIQ